jgi:hypothetical protein
MFSYIARSNHIEDLLLDDNRLHEDGQLLACVFQVPGVHVRDYFFKIVIVCC